MKTILLVYVASVIFSFGAINADTQAQCFTFHDTRMFVAENIPFAFFPGANLLIAVFGTGLMEHGWTLDIPAKGEHVCRP